MQTVFLLSAVIGGTILVLQVALSLLGLGLDHVLHLGGDLPVHQGNALPPVGHLGDASAADVGPAAHVHADSLTTHGDHQGLYKLGRLLTLQTILAFVTFFGIGGLATLERGQPALVAVPVALGTGLASMMVLGFLFGSLTRLQSDGTVRMAEARGCRGRVYLTVPGNDAGQGKVTVVVNGRELELAARTVGPMLFTGEEVVVSRVINDHTVEVVTPASYVDKPEPVA